VEEYTLYANQTHVLKLFKVRKTKEAINILRKYWRILVNEIKKPAEDFPLVKSYRHNGEPD